MPQDYWEISDADLDWAKEKVAKFINPGEHENNLETPTSKMIGYLGERMFQNRFPEAKHMDQRHMDFQMGRWTIDVKSKHTKGDIRQYAHVHVNEMSAQRLPQIYVWVWLHLEDRVAFFPGYCLRKHWAQRSSLVLAGESHPDFPTYRIKHAARFMPIALLDQFQNEVSS